MITCFFCFCTDILQHRHNHPRYNDLQTTLTIYHHHQSLTIKPPPPSKRHHDQHSNSNPSTTTLPTTPTTLTTPPTTLTTSQFHQLPSQPHQPHQLPSQPHQPLKNPIKHLIKTPYQTAHSHRRYRGAKGSWFVRQGATQAWLLPMWLTKWASLCASTCRPPPSQCWCEDSRTKLVEVEIF